MIVMVSSGQYDCWSVDFLVEMSAEELADFKAKSAQVSAEIARLESQLYTAERLFAADPDRFQEELNAAKEGLKVLLEKRSALRRGLDVYPKVAYEELDLG